MAVNHTQRDHALLSASGASRWLNCPPSARLEERQKTSSSSVYAKEGTLAHEIADISVRLETEMISKKVYNAEMRKLKSHELFDDEMLDHAGTFVSIVKESYQSALSLTDDAELLVEERLDFSHIVPQGFGTGDATVVGDRTLEVIDYKYGKGIKVEAESNPQLKLYATGALTKYDMLFDIEEVRMTIVQPRLNHYSTSVISKDELVEWAEDIVKPIAHKAFNGEGRKHAGEWCKFCKVKAMCKTYADKNLELARYDFKNPDELTIEDLALIKTQIPMLIDWANAVDKYLLDKATSGVKIPGMKLVEGRSNRKWKNEQAVVDILSSMYEKNKFVNEKLAGIMHIQKLLGKDEFKELLSEHVVKPPGKPALVEEADPRPEFGIGQAQEDFK